MPQQFATARWSKIPWLGACIVALCGCGKSAPLPAPDVPDQPLPTVPAVPLEASFTALHAREDLGNEVRWDVALVLAEISTITYDTDAEQVRRLRELGAETVKPLARKHSQGLVASDAKTVVIAFRGTEPTVPADIITDINIFSRRTREGRVHAGFHQSVSDLYELAIAEAVRQGAQDKVVWVTGHSLGGAMAMVFSHRVTIENKMRPDGIVTFGQPLAVDRRICQYMIDEFKQNYVRFVNQWDPITRLLPNYRHAGARVHLNGDTYSLREPQVSFTALADDGQRPAEFVEDEPGLQTMTEGEFEELERQLKEQSTASNGHQGAVAALSIPILSDHSMDNYVARLRSIGARYFKRPTGSSP